ncbi:MAG: hypothetical protein AAF798_21165 [Bacteroidota bacterium]
MNRISCTLLADGSSDIILQYPIKWLLTQEFPNYATTINFADLRPISTGNETLPERICKAVELFPCDILFIHRDIEKETFESRMTEIVNALAKANCDVPLHVKVLPKKMSEAWFLFDEQAIKTAAGNPNSRLALNLPTLGTLEQLPDPKESLITILKTASGLNKRRIKSFRPRRAIHRLAEIIDNYSKLESLEAFQILAHQIQELKNTFNQPSD